MMLGLHARSQALAFHILLLCSLSFHEVNASLQSRSRSSAAIHARQFGPRVTISSGSYTGVSSNGMDTFYGLPFAQPPVDDLRLRAPVPFSRTSSAPQDATQPKRDCPNGNSLFSVPGPIAQFTGQIEQIIGQIFPQAKDMSEDCLYLNVFRPANTLATANLPVMVWIYGGAFSSGGISMYNGQGIIQQSVAQGQPVIVVAVNYRAAGWGFLGGAEARQAGTANLGLLDQREGFRWVQKNIAAFGGDPTKVTIFGESSGAISVGLQALLNGGNNEGLWRAAITQSGSADFVGDVSLGQAGFDKVVDTAGCTAAADKIACLRKAPVSTFRNAVQSVPGLLNAPDGRSLALAFRPRVDGKVLTDTPQNLLRAGKFAKVPLITGDCADEATVFTLQAINYGANETGVRSYFQGFYPRLSAATWQKLAAGYPADPAAGSPFGSGTNFAFTAQYKRLTAILGDTVFQAPRRFAQQIWNANNVPVYSYAFNVYSTGLNENFLGTYHGSDILKTFPTGAGLNDVQSKRLLALWISFAATLDPNKHNQPLLGLPNWPRFDQQAKSQINFNATGTFVGADTYRSAGIQAIVDNPDDFIR